MNFIKAQFDRLGKQVALLNASQKMLAGALLAIMLMTIVMWGKYASSPELAAVLDQDLAPDEISRIKDFLEMKGYTPQVVGSRVMVPSERKLEAFSDISFHQLLPRDTTSAFDVILSKMSPWDPASKTEVMWNQMKEMHLAQVMRGWPGVADAHVMIDSKEKHGLSGSQPSAMVDIRTRPDDRTDKQLIGAAVALIRGSVSGIEPSRVSVIIDGVSRKVQDSGAGSLNGDELALRHDAEQSYTDKVRERLSYIDGLVVAVTAEVNTKSIEEHTTKYDSKGTVQKELQSTSKTDESASAQSSGEPGVGANTQAQVTDGGGEKGKTSNNEESNTYLVKVPESDTQTHEGPGRATIKSATVGVPRSYFTRVYKVLNPNDKDVNQVTFDKIMSDELAKIKTQVKAATNLTDDLTVAVDSYVDVNPVMLAASQTVAVTASSGVGNLLGSHVREVGAGALALISLFMVSMMVKKGAAPAVVAAAAGGGAQIQFESSESVGEAGAAGATLDGMELDEESVKAQEMIGQVSTLVRENPDAAATLVKRWLNR